MNDNENPNISRRSFLKKLSVIVTAAATGLLNKTAAANDSLEETKAAPNIFDELKKYEFIGQDGKPVNIEALRTANKGKYLTVSFGFKDCDKFCPDVNRRVGKMGELAKKGGTNFTSIIVSVKPYEDGKNQASRDAFIKKLRTAYNVKQNIIILYPTENGVESGTTFEASLNAPKLAISLGAIVDMKEPVRHSGSVMLFSPGGEKISMMSGMMDTVEEFEKSWTKYLNPQQKISR